MIIRKMVMTICVYVFFFLLLHGGLEASRLAGKNRYVRASGTLSMSASVSNPDYELSLRSPCKINLFLRITGRRDTGYHDLASLFQTISLSDYMHFSLLPPGATKDEFVCSDSSLRADDSNLVIKALDLMRCKSSVKDAYFKVRLDKKVPMQAGLGGGSGNAATAMFAFNKLTGFKHTLHDLIEWSGDIGSDVSFFFSTGTAYCTGRGEIIQPLPALPHAEDLKVHVFKPQEGLSTGLVFKTLHIESMCSPSDPMELLGLFRDMGALKAASFGGLENDLEAPAFICSPDLSKLKDEIIETMERPPCKEDEECGIGDPVVMSGSGTSIYCLTDKSPALERESAGISNLLKKHEGLKYYECTFINKKNDVDSWYTD